MTSKPQSSPIAPSSSYPLSRSLAASARLNFQFFLWKDTLTFNIHPSIPLPRDNLKIADIATGTAIWLIDTARENQKAECQGFDISLDQAPCKEWLPQNVSLRIWDIYSEVPEDLVGKFDLVHLRLLGLSVGDGDTGPVFRNVIKMLKPGGHFQWDELCEAQGYVKTVQTGTEAPALSEFLRNMNAREKSDWSLQLPESAKDAGFEDARLYRFWDRSEMSRPHMEIAMLFIQEWADRLEASGKETEAEKYRGLVKGVAGEIVEGAVFCIPKVVCVARKSPGKEIVMRSDWFVKELGNLDPETVEFYRNWSGLDGDALVSHVQKIRDLAWAITPFPCIGMFMFVTPNIKLMGSYASIVARAQIKGTTILDMGCCFGQNLRALAFEGISTENMYATDLRSEFWELGFQLFRDREKMKATFIQASILDPDEESPLLRFSESMDIIIACLFLHLFDWDEQVIAMRKIVKLSKPGTVVVGRQMATLERGRIVPRSWGNPFFHDLSTFKAIWRLVGMETGTTWNVDATLRSSPGRVVMVENQEPQPVIEFAVTRAS